MRRLEHDGFLAVLLGLVAVAVALNRWVCDDAYISFRYARNLVAGLGLRYNPGSEPPVEGFSNPLWLLPSAIAEALSWRPWILVCSVSALCGLILVARVFRYATSRLGLSAAAATAVALTLGLSPPFLVWSTSGLETMAFCLAIFLVAEQLLLVPGWNPHLATGAGLALLLLRPEGFAWVLGLFLVSMFDEKRIERVRLFLLPCAGMFLLATLGRMAYFGQPLPHTYYAKVGWSSGEFARGLDYVLLNGLTLLVPLLALVVFLLAFAFNPARRALLLKLGTAALAPYAYAVAVGGDYMSYGRMILPSLPFQALVLAVGVETLRRFSRRSFVALAMLAGAVVAGCLPLFDVYVVPREIRQKFHVRTMAPSFLDENDHLRFMKRNSADWKKVGLWLAEIAPPNGSVVVGAIGNVGYFSGLRIYDPHGLVTRLPDDTPRDLRSPGHDLKVNPTFFLPQRPTFLSFAMPDSRPALDAALLTPQTLAYPYAPEVHLREGAGGSGGAALVVYRRMGSERQYRDQWARIERLRSTQ